MNSTEKPDMDDPQWQRDLINRLALAAVTEQRRSRRWNIFFRSLLWLYLFALLAIVLAGKFGQDGIVTGEHTAVVNLDGVIADDADASARNVIRGLRDAYEANGTRGVILRVNSPGGSPVQSNRINQEIHRLRDKYPDIPFYAVVEDMCASGGYFVAVAAQEIYGDASSIVGSIGVRMDSFGFVDAIDKLGIERRLMTAGEHKGFLDPFLPENPEDKAHIRGVLHNIHNRFIEAVKEGRGDRLVPDPKLFSGLVWTGEQGVRLGLIDGLKSVDGVARELIGAEKLVDYTVRPDFWEEFGARVGESASVAFRKMLTPVTLFN